MAWYSDMTVARAGMYLNLSIHVNVSKARGGGGVLSGYCPDPGSVFFSYLCFTAIPKLQSQASKQ